MTPYTKLPQRYAALWRDELTERIAARKEQLGADLCILAHHYQRDNVFQFADLTGDSLKLSQQAAAQKDAKFIVFCGVHFMAESADVLSSASQAVVLPNLQAGCPMADMADEASVAAALQELSGLTDAKIVPITYVNSSAAVKALTARAGGACCTSSNVRNVFEWALRGESEGGAGGAGAEKVLVIPDQHLGRNTAVAMGYSLEDCAVYDPTRPNGGLDREDVKRATFILWAGHCYVHQLFTAEHVRSVRRRHKDIRVIVHPESPHEVVKLCDASGSTEQTIGAVDDGEGAGNWAIGTESNLVNRLAKRHPDQFIRILSDAPALCLQMGRITLRHLLWVLDNLAEGKVVNRISVEGATADDARVALQRMIDINPTRQATPT